MMSQTSVFEPLFRNAEPIILNKGDVLHRSTEHCRTMGLVLSGEIRLSRVLSTGKEIFLKNFRQGDLFAELIVFSAENYPGWLIASEPSRVAEVKQSQVLAFLGGSDPLISYLESVSRKMTHLSRSIEVLSLKTVRQKIAFALLNEETGTQGVPMNITRFAGDIYCSREAVSRELSAMEAEGLLKREDGIILLPGDEDKKRLESLI